MICDAEAGVVDVLVASAGIHSTDGRLGPQRQKLLCITNIDITNIDFSRGIVETVVDEEAAVRCFDRAYKVALSLLDVGDTVEGSRLGQERQCNKGAKDLEKT